MRGGKRANAGRPKGEPTKTISFRVKLENVDEIKRIVKEYFQIKKSTMTPKEKAKELFERMYYKIQPDELGRDQESAKNCALVAVDEILEDCINLRYWQEVKNEIEKL